MKVASPPSASRACCAAHALHHRGGWHQPFGRPFSGGGAYLATAAPHLPPRAGAVNDARAPWSAAIVPLHGAVEARGSSPWTPRLRPVTHVAHCGGALAMASAAAAAASAFAFLSERQILSRVVAPGWTAAQGWQAKIAQGWPTNIGAQVQGSFSRDSFSQNTGPSRTVWADPVKRTLHHRRTFS